MTLLAVAALKRWRSRPVDLMNVDLSDLWEIDLPDLPLASEHHTSIVTMDIYYSGYRFH